MTGAMIIVCRATMPAFKRIGAQKRMHVCCLLALILMLARFGTMHYASVDTIRAIDANLSLEVRLGPTNAPWASNVTFVTALYDIGRADRSYSSYKEWTSQTLRLPQAFVIFCRMQDVSWIAEARLGQKTLIITEEEFPLEYLKDETQKILHIEARGRTCQTCPEWVNPKYIPLQFSKAVWLQRAMARNPFSSHTFFWIDAGLSRFFDQTNMHYGLSRSDAQLEPDRVYITLGQSLVEFAKTPRPMIGSQQAFLAGGFFGGHVMPVTRMCQALVELLHTQMLARHRLDNEQIAFHHIYAKHKDWFRVLDRSALGCGFMCM